MRTRLIGAFAVASCSTVLAVGLTAALPAQQDPSEPCCAIKTINARTRMVTVTEKATACTYEFQAKEAKDLDGLKAGTAIRVDVKQLPATSGPTGSTGQAASGADACGSNVPRNAKTKTLCKVMTGPNSWEYKPC
jgi:hypothetical protein